MNRAQIKQAILTALADDIGIEIPDSGKGHGPVQMGDEEIILGTEIASNGARHIYSVQLEDLIDALDLETLLSAKGNISYQDLVDADANTTPEEDPHGRGRGYKKHLDRWKAEGKIS